MRLVSKKLKKYGPGLTISTRGPIDLAEQYSAIGWVGDILYSVIFKIREDDGGYIITA